MKRKPLITHKMLRAAGACQGQRELFMRRFPTGRVEVTVKNAERYARQFNWRFMADHFLGDEERKKWYLVNRSILQWSSYNADQMIRATAFAKLYLSDGNQW